MNLQISGHHVSVTPAMEAHAREKLSKVTARFESVPNVRIICRVEDAQKARDKQQQAQITMSVNGREFHAEHASECCYKSLNAACEKLDRQVIQTQERSHEYRVDKRQMV